MITLEEVRLRAESDAKTYGYCLNPEPESLKNLLEGLKANVIRYGYPSCPCRLALGKFELDRDIVCPCDYRDPDVEEYGYCYCALYVRKDVSENPTSIVPIPERRPKEKASRTYEVIKTVPNDKTLGNATSEVKRTIWYCQQCGYVCYREDPPYICPICKAKREMFSAISRWMEGQG